jgi:hypothetical protein
MINIKRFIERVSMLESRQSKDFVMPMNEARALRDELAKFLIDHYQVTTAPKKVEEPVFKVDMKGGSFK